MVKHLSSTTDDPAMQVQIEVCSVGHALNGICNRHKQITHTYKIYMHSDR